MNNVYPDDSGKYWCQADGGNRSNSINISVTGNKETIFCDTFLMILISLEPQTCVIQFVLWSCHSYNERRCDSVLQKQDSFFHLHNWFQLIWTSHSLEIHWEMLVHSVSKDFTSVAFHELENHLRAFSVSQVICCFYIVWYKQMKQVHSVSPCVFTSS